MCVTVWCHLCPAEAQLDVSGRPRASRGVRGTDPAGDFLALLSSADTILQMWGFFLVDFIPDAGPGPLGWVRGPVGTMQG